MSENDRVLLDQKLSKLLGFEDGVSDVVEHLLSIESYNDLVDYLSQLLGSSNQEALESFAADVGRFQHGEPILPEEEPKAKVTTPDKEPKDAEVMHLKNRAAAAAAQNSSKPSNNNNNNNNNQIRNEGTTVTTRSNKKLPPNTAKSKPVAIKKKAPKQANNNNTKVPAANSKESLAPKAASTNKTKTGVAPFTCGCFGNLHQALTNCLHCGRIACVKEGYNFCPFCGYMIEERPPGKPEGISDATWELKERMLLYDRKSAHQRTVVVDDHADYYQSGIWKDAQEEEAAMEREQERQNRLHKRRHMQMNIGL